MLPLSGSSIIFLKKIPSKSCHFVQQGIETQLIFDLATYSNLLNLLFFTIKKPKKNGAPQWFLSSPWSLGEVILRFCDVCFLWQLVFSWWKNGTTNDESSWNLFFQARKLPFLHRISMSHLCPVPARIPRACTTSSNPKATKHVNDCEWICCQSEWVKPVILPILNVFGLPKTKIPAQRHPRPQF